MNNIKDKYEYVGEFHQGVAIIIKNDKYGAVMVGGKEIFSPIYHELSEFKDGYAVAKSNGEERVVNLSGQIQVFKGDKDVKNLYISVFIQCINSNTNTGCVAVTLQV